MSRLDNLDHNAEGRSDVVQEVLMGPYAAVLQDFARWLAEEVASGETEEEADEWGADPAGMVGADGLQAAQAALAGTDLGGGPSDLEDPDLYSLFAEMSALRQEIKLQNREQRRAAQQLETATTLFDEGLATFAVSQEGLAQLEERIAHRSLRRTVGAFFPVRDALARGRDAAQRVASDGGVWRRLFRHQQRQMESIAQGYTMALARFDRCLESLDIRVTNAVGQPFDPSRMQAVSWRSDSSHEDDIVLEELAAGFVCGDEVLRPAEVVVNRRGGL